MHFLSKHPFVTKIKHQSLKNMIFAHFSSFTKRSWSKTKQIRKWKWQFPLYGSKLEFPPPHYNFSIVQWRCGYLGGSFGQSCNIPYSNLLQKCAFFYYRLFLFCNHTCVSLPWVALEPQTVVASNSPVLFMVNIMIIKKSHFFLKIIATILIICQLQYHHILR